jgi:hypothetical protein
VDSLGDVVAEGVQRDQLQSVIDKWRLVSLLKKALVGRTIEFQLSRGNGVYYLGEELSLVSGSLRSNRYVAVLGLAPDGKINVLHPAKNILEHPDLEKPWPSGVPFTIPRIRVTPPFGADHVFLVSSSKPLAPLFTQVAKANATSLPSMLDHVLANADFELGLVGIYTRKAK